MQLISIVYIISMPLRISSLASRLRFLPPVPLERFPQDIEWGVAPSMIAIILTIAIFIFRSR